MRTRSALERSDLRRVMELEKAIALVLPQECKESRVENFELPPTRQPAQPVYPRGCEDTEEMTRALRALSLFYGGPPLEILDYSGMNSPPFYTVPPDSDPESPYPAMTPEYSSDTPPEHPEVLDHDGDVVIFG